MQTPGQSARLSAQKKTGTGGRFGHLQQDAPPFGLEDRIPTLKDGEVGQYASERAWGVITSTKDNLGSLAAKHRAGEQLTMDSNASVRYAAEEAARQIHGNLGRHMRVLGADLARRLVPTAEAWARGEEHDLEPALSDWADAVDRYIEGQHATTSGKSWDTDEEHNDRSEIVHAYNRLIASQEKRRDKQRTSEKNRAIYQRDIDELREARDEVATAIAAEPDPSWSRYYRAQGSTQTHVEPGCEFIGERLALVVSRWSGLDEVEVKAKPNADVCPRCFGAS